MRVDARDGDTDWDVYHVPTCRVLKLVCWVSDSPPSYGEWPDEGEMESALIRHHVLGWPLNPPVFKVRDVRFDVFSRVAYVDPVADPENESVADVINDARGIRSPAFASSRLQRSNAGLALGSDARGVF